MACVAVWLVASVGLVAGQPALQWRKPIAIIFAGDRPGEYLLIVYQDGTLAFAPGQSHEETAARAMKKMCSITIQENPPGEMSIGAAVYVSGEDGSVVFGPTFKGNDEDKADWLIIGKAYVNRCTI